MAMWYFLQRICPALAKAVDAKRIYELLLLHDVGETQSGDVSMYQKILGFDANKKKEREMIEMMSNNFPETTGIGKEVVGNFDAFETPVKKSETLEQLVARLIDSIQGGHFATVYANDLANYSLPIENILKVHFVPTVNFLLSLLKKKGLDDASEEVVQVVLAQIRIINEAGVKVTEKSLGLQL
jgi:5'-deoxynucleotidase YfbR-like HD superfamily hydrolase